VLHKPMSYILDALKKAEGERQLGRAPGIHSPSAQPTRAAFGWPARIHVVVWSLGVIALLVALTLWWSRDRTGAQAPAVQAEHSEMAAPAAPTRQVSAATATAAAPGKPEAVAGAGSNPAPGMNPTPEAALRKHAESTEKAKPTDEARSEHKTRSAHETKQASAEPVVVPKPKPKSAPHSSLAARRREASAGAEAVGGAPSKQAASTAEPIVALAALPPETRTQIPAFNITGFLYAGSRSERSILIDNRLMHEGDQVAAGVLLEEMRPSYAIFSYRGTRFSMPYR
jgi:general secretion pathway protein B